MHLDEYNKIKEYGYLEYCDYLQKKYGIGRGNFFTKSWNKNPKITRTSEGLFAHHKYEDHAIMLSNKEYAINNPYEWQLAKNIVYCDFLEHLYLHILICEYPAPTKNLNEAVGIGGVINYLVPQLNDFYSGFVSNKSWQQNCFNLVKSDKDVYLILLKRFKESCQNYPLYKDDCLYKSYNEEYFLWSKNKNKKIFSEIEEL